MGNGRTTLVVVRIEAIAQPTQPPKSFCKSQAFGEQYKNCWGRGEVPVIHMRKERPKEATLHTFLSRW